MKTLYRVKIANESGHLSYAITDAEPVWDGDELSWTIDYFTNIEDGDTFGAPTVTVKWVTWRKVKPGEVSIPAGTERSTLEILVPDPEG